MKKICQNKLVVHSKAQLTLQDVMFGGTETVASVLEWAMSELLQTPEELKKVQQELADVVGLDRKVHEADLDNLPYLKCVVKEILRLHPPIPLLFHEATEDGELAGYFIPRRARMWVNVWAIGRDKPVWTEPDSFQPYSLHRAEVKRRSTSKGIILSSCRLGRAAGRAQGCSWGCTHLG